MASAASSACGDIQGRCGRPAVPRVSRPAGGSGRVTRSPPVSPGIGLAGTELRARACRAGRRLRADTDGWSWPGSCLQRLPGPS